MGRTLTPERQRLKPQAIVLRKMGWTLKSITEQTGIPDQTLSRWFSQNDMAKIMGRRGVKSHNLMSVNMGKPTFLSSCCRVEEFAPADSIKLESIKLGNPQFSNENSRITNTRGQKLAEIPEVIFEGYPQ